MLDNSVLNSGIALSISIIYLYLLSYYTDLRVINGFGIHSTTFFRTFHAHLVRGVFIAIHPINLILILVVSVIVFFVLTIIASLLSITTYKYIYIWCFISIVVVTGSWITTHLIAGNRIGAINERNPNVLVKTKTDDAITGVVIIEDSTRVAVLFRNPRRILVLSWNNIEYIEYSTEASSNNLAG